MTGLVDTHAHVMDRTFDMDRDRVLANAQNNGVVAMLLVGYDLASSRAAVELARQIPWAKASVGIHPNSAAEHSDADFQAIAELARDENVIAIGETGLDHYRHYTSPARQRQALEWHVELAEELGRALVIHNRLADADIAAALGSGLTASGVLHCFSSTDAAYLGRMLDAGFYVSFAGPLTYKSADDLRAMATRVPLDRLLIETDCPYLPPVPHRGQRNEPAYVRYTFERLADLRHMDRESLKEQLWVNSLALLPALARTQQAAA